MTMAGMFGHGAGTAAADNRAFKQQLNKVYAWYMNNLDRRYGVHEGEDE